MTNVININSAAWRINILTDNWPDTFKHHRNFRQTGGSHKHEKCKGTKFSQQAHLEKSSYINSSISSISFLKQMGDGEGWQQN